MPTIRTSRTLAATVAAVIAGGLAATPASAGSVPGGPAPQSPVPADSPTRAAVSAPLSFRIDPTVDAPHDRLEPVGRSRADRAAGVLVTPDGARAELVLDEVMLRVDDPAELDAFLARWNGIVLDSFPADADGQDHLVRVDSGRADPAALTVDLLATEPRQTGVYRTDDDRVLRLLALAAAEWRAGTHLVLDWLVEPAGISQGTAYEAPTIAKNVFDWSYLRSGGALDTGVAPAWQLLQAKGKLTRQMRYLVQDGGFQQNPDLPDQVSLHKATWGETNPNDCTNGTSCPWHGTEVALAGMGRVDNGYGVAGPGGPVTKRLIAVGNSLDYWSVLRRLEKVAEETHPDVVILSFTRDVHVGRTHAQTWTDRRMDHVRKTGALIVAAAGNNATSVDSDVLYVPCESKHVMCVGGVAGDATRSGGSNYGQGDSETSVEIYGPMCVQVLLDSGNPNLNQTKNQCGTSIAAPFVGGVAALVKAADPTLTSAQIRDILNDTAHVGGLGAEVTGSQRRIDALAAVAKALGVPLHKPVVTIDKPTAGQKLGAGQSVDLWGEATDFFGKQLPITWTSSIDGTLGDDAKTVVPPLSPGKHVITASATDGTGRTGSASVTVTVVDTPAVVAITSPPASAKLAEGQAVQLAATSHDPDTADPAPNAQVTWTVKRGDTTVHQATGHQATLPAVKATPGAYTAVFTAGGTTVQRAFTVIDVPAGQSAPTATITVPKSDVHLKSTGKPVAVSFAGTGTDAQDGALSGTRYRWTAYGNGGVTKVLCEGSQVPHDGPIDQIIMPQNCASFTAGLGLLAGPDPTTTWTVRLEAFDFSGLVGTDTVTVTIDSITP